MLQARATIERKANSRCEIHGALFFSDNTKQICFDNNLACALNMAAIIIDSDSWRNDQKSFELAARVIQTILTYLCFSNGISLSGSR